MPSISDVKKRKPEHAPAHMPVREQPQTIRTLRWQAPEYIHYEKTADWYWSAGVIMLALLVSSYYLESILFAFLIVIGGVAVMLYGARRPNTITFEVSGMGVRVGDRLFPFETLQSFWIFYRAGDTKELSIRSEQLLVPMIKIPLGDQDPTALRELLLDFMPEVAQEESLVDVLARLLKF